MQVKVYSLYDKETLIFQGSLGEVYHKLLYQFPFLHECRNLQEAVQRLDRTQAYSAAITDQTLLKDETHMSSHVIDDMHGFAPEREPAFEAARFLSGLHPVNRDIARKALYEEGEMNNAALKAYGLPITEDNLKALQAVMDLSTLKKGDLNVALDGTKIPEVLALTQDGVKTKENIEKAYKAGLVLPVKLAGKHSSGSLIARDDEDGKSYLLKPGSDTQSPAAGVTEETASQSAREACFYHVAKDWNIGQWLPEAELLSLDGKLFSCQSLLPFSYGTLERRAKTDPALPQRLLRIPLSTGDLHKWAAIDAILGNVDRHGQNIMINEDGDIKLIDHGSAFAGDSFDPAHDQNSFVPFYLRAWAPVAFNKLGDSEKSKYLPRVSEKTASLLRDWLASIDEEKMHETLARYGINPEPSLKRLHKIRKMSQTMPVDEAINRFWVVT